MFCHVYCNNIPTSTLFITKATKLVSPIKYNFAVKCVYTFKMI